MANDVRIIDPRDLPCDCRPPGSCVENELPTCSVDGQIITVPGADATCPAISYVCVSGEWVPIGSGVINPTAAVDNNFNTQVINSSAYTQLVFTDIQHDSTGGIMPNVPAGLTIPETGVYVMSLNYTTELPNPASASGLVQVRSNGGEVGRQAFSVTSSWPERYGDTLTFQKYMVAGSQLTAYALVNNVGTASIGFRFIRLVATLLTRCVLNVGIDRFDPAGG